MAKKSHRSRIATLLMPALTLILGGYIYYALTLPLPMLQPSERSLQLQAATGVSKLSWPTTGQSAVAVNGTPILETHGNQVAAPTASVAKVITALVTLQRKPLTSDESGPSLTLSDADVALYNSYVTVGGSVVPVSNGEVITQRQALEAMMLPSANNIADSFAIWAFGSLVNYSAAATQYINSLGLKDTHIGTDASGFSPTTTSSAHDLAIIGEKAMQQPVLRQIINQPNATDIPETTVEKNVNFLLGTAGIIGIKTGNTDQAGGVYLSASTVQINNAPTTIITAYVGAPTLFQALQGSLPLITSAQTNFSSTSQLLAANDVVAEYQQPWGGSLPATAETKLTTTAWKGSTVRATANLSPISADSHVGQVVGTAVSPKTPFSNSSVIRIILQNKPTRPSVWWRLMHIRR
jgi:D-alanyl-D-alanine carboxypeptidase (penicillin-binding protein 5/6)